MHMTPLRAVLLTIGSAMLAIVALGGLYRAIQAAPARRARPALVAPVSALSPSVTPARPPAESPAFSGDDYEYCRAGAPPLRLGSGAYDAVFALGAGLAIERVDTEQIVGDGARLRPLAAWLAVTRFGGRADARPLGRPHLRPDRPLRGRLDAPLPRVAGLPLPVRPPRDRPRTASRGRARGRVALDRDERLADRSSSALSAAGGASCWSPTSTTSRGPGCWPRSATWRPTSSRPSRSSTPALATRRCTTCSARTSATPGPTVRSGRSART